MMVNNGQIISQLHGVSKTFSLSGGRELQVLTDVDLTIRQGEIVALLGPTGCGKSTLMRILAGLLKPTEGTVEYCGREIHAVNPAVSVVFENFALFPWLTVAENIEESLRRLRFKAVRRKQRVTHVIDLIGLEGFEELYPRELSGGMKQRLSIARALVVEPEILCLDEPFSQVDALTAESLRSEVIRLWLDQDRNPKSIFMVSHDVKEVVALSTRIIVFGSHPGNILAVVENPLPYPRDYRDPSFIQLQERIHELLTHGIMPDEEGKPISLPGRASAEPPIEVLPTAQVSQIIGLLEMLDDRGGEVNIFAFANELQLEFGRTIAVAKAAEMLDLVDTPRLPREEVLDKLNDLLQAEKAETMFEILANWAQYGQLFILDSDEDKLMPYEYQSATGNQA